MKNYVHVVNVAIRSGKRATLVAVRELMVTIAAKILVAVPIQRTIKPAMRAGAKVDGVYVSEDAIKTANTRNPSMKGLENDNTGSNQNWQAVQTPTSGLVFRGVERIYLQDWKLYSRTDFGQGFVRRRLGNQAMTPLTLEQAAERIEKEKV